MSIQECRYKAVSFTGYPVDLNQPKIPRVEVSEATWKNKCEPFCVGE
jgi:hypothetical protein